MSSTTQMIEELKGDMKSVVVEIKYLKASVDAMNETVTGIEKRTRDLEQKQSSQDTKISNMSVLQSGLSIVIGAVAAFWGGKN